MFDYYRILGVSPTATTTEIRTAYRRLAQQHHPHHGGDQDRMSEINQAWELLGRQSSRSAYDRQRWAAAQDTVRRPAPSASPNVEDDVEDDEPWEPGGTWWDETTYRPRRDYRPPTSQSPPYQQKRHPTSTGVSAAWKAWVSRSIPVGALLYYIGWLLDTWRAGSFWHWLAILIFTLPFWAFVFVAQSIVREFLGHPKRAYK